MKKRPCWLRWSANLLLWAAVGWIGHQLIMALLARRDVIKAVNQATTSCRRNPRRAERILNQARMDAVAARRTAAERFLAFAGLPFPALDQQVAGVYEALGDFNAARYDHVSAIRAYAMCLAHDPAKHAFAFDLGAGCMQMENYELGYFVGELVNRGNPGRGEIYFRFFGKRFKPDWTAGKGTTR